MIRREEGVKIWENFCEQKVSQTLSKNFDWGTRRERRVPKALIEEQPKIIAVFFN
jgi:hypothetical protein